MNKLIYSLILLLVIGGIFYVLNSNTEKESEVIVAAEATDHRNAVYMIEGQSVQLINGLAETESAPDSTTKVTTRYFGNELITDLDADGVDDIAFILTQETGGSGLFYYAVGAVKTDEGYIGTDGYLLGDRIAPQSTDVSPNPKHKYVVVFNYVDRALGEALTTSPSVGKSAYLKLVPETMQWAIVEPDFEGESNLVE